MGIRAHFHQNLILPAAAWPLAHACLLRCGNLSAQRKHPPPKKSTAPQAGTLDRGTKSKYREQLFAQLRQAFLAGGIGFQRLGPGHIDVAQLAVAAATVNGLEQ